MMPGSIALDTPHSTGEEARRSGRHVRLQRKIHGYSENTAEVPLGFHDRGLVHCPEEVERSPSP
jgi:hypothetical protein